MEYSRELLFFFSALGVFNGLLLAIYFLAFAKPNHPSNSFLGVLLLSLSIRIGKSVFYYFDHDLSRHFLQLGLTACFFIGPFLYFYVRSMLQNGEKPFWRWRIHLAVLLPIALVVGLLYPYDSYVELWRNHFIFIIYMVWLAYTIATGFALKDSLKKLVQKGMQLSSSEIWMQSLFFGNSLIWAAYFFAGITSYLLGAILFSFMLYLLVLLLFLKRKREPVLPVARRQAKVPTEEDKLLLEKLNALMETKSLYRNPNLKLADVAKALGTSPHNLSSLLNEQLGHGFPHFLNRHRIEQAKALILTNQTDTLEAIGYDSGFNSKSTFFSAFKKITGTTPARFKADQSDH